MANNTILGFALAVTAAVGLVLALVSHSSAPAATSTLPLTAISTSPRAGDKDGRASQRMLTELAQLRARVASLENSATEKQGSSKEIEQQDGQVPEANPPSPEEAAENRRHVRATIDDALKGESPDVTWSRDTRSKLRADFDAAELKETRLSAIDCAATFCRLQAHHRDRSAKERFEDFASERGMGTLILTDTGEHGELSTSAYLIRRGRDEESHIVRQMGATL